MTLRQLIIQTGEIPKTCQIENGIRFDLFMCVFSDGSAGAMMWQMEGDKKSHLFCFGTGDSEALAKEDLKKRLLA